MAAHTAAGRLLQGHPTALLWFGNAALLVPALLLAVLVFRRRRDWSGCQWIFWATFALGMILWSVGHVGWAIDYARGRTPWLNWHTGFTLVGGLAPLLALLARPHRGPRPSLATSVAVDIAACAILAGFGYAYFFLVPNLERTLQDVPPSFLIGIQAQRVLLFLAMAWAAWTARGTDWSAPWAWPAARLT